MSEVNRRQPDLLRSPDKQPELREVADVLSSVDGVRGNPGWKSVVLGALLSACANTDNNRLDTDAQSYAGDAYSAPDTVENIEHAYTYGTPKRMVLHDQNVLTVSGEFIPGEQMRAVFYNKNADLIADENVIVEDVNYDGIESVDIAIDPSLEPVTVKILDANGKEWGEPENLKPSEPMEQFPEKSE